MYFGNYVFWFFFLWICTLIYLNPKWFEGIMKLCYLSKLSSFSHEKGLTKISLRCSNQWIQDSYHAFFLLIYFRLIALQPTLPRCFSTLKVDQPVLIFCFVWLKSLYSIIMSLVSDVFGFKFVRSNILNIRMAYLSYYMSSFLQNT